MPSCYAFQETSIPVQDTCGCSKDCLILIPFRLPQISCFTLSLKCSPLPQTIALCGDQYPASVPLPAEAGPVLLTPLFFPLAPSSYRVLRGSIDSFPLVRSSCPLSVGVLHALLSEGVSLMYLWREMYPTSTSSTAILFSYFYFCVLCFWSHSRKIIAKSDIIKLFLVRFLLGI